jgi:hypothetical protein
VSRPAARVGIPIGTLAGVLVFLTLVSRFPKKLYHWDEFQLSYAVLAFDLARHEPHPPGYYLFVVLGRMANALTGDPALALRCVSAAALAGFAALALGRPQAGEQPAARWLRASAVASFAVLSPLLSRFGVAALSYAAEAAVWLALLLALTQRPRGLRLYALACAIGLAGGIRPTLLVWGAAAVVFEALRAPGWIGWRALPGLAGAGAAGIAAWAVPLLRESGGLSGYHAAAGALAWGNIWARSVFVSGFDGWGGRLASMSADLAEGLGALLAALAALLVLRVRRRDDDALTRLDPLIFGGALVFAFYALVVYDTRGYLVAAALPLAAWTFLTAGRLLAGLAPGWQLGGAAALLLAACLTPLVPGESRPHERYDIHDTLLEARFAPVRDGFDPAHTVLVTSREYWDYALRHVAHELPEFATLQLAFDPFFAIVSAERPYLAARDRRLEAVGPDDLDLATLLPAGPLRRVVYMVPFDAGSFLGTSCAPLVQKLPTTSQEELVVLRVPPDWRVTARSQRLECGRLQEEEGW